MNTFEQVSNDHHQISLAEGIPGSNVQGCLGPIGGGEGIPTRPIS